MDVALWCYKWLVGWIGYIWANKALLKPVKGSWGSLRLGPLPCWEAETRASKHVGTTFSTICTPNVCLQGPSKLLRSLPYKGNADDHHPHHNPLDAHKVDLKEIFFVIWQNICSMEFDCTVRNIKNLDFSIYVSFCVSYVPIVRNCTFKETSIINHFSPGLQISVALELPADLLSIVGLEWLGRRSKLPTHERKKPNSCLSGGQLPFPCWLLVWPSCHALGLPTIPCLRQSLPWLEDSLPPMPWTLDFSSLLRWFEDEDDHRSLVFPGAADHPEGPGYGSVPNDVHGWPSCIAPYRLLG